MKREEEITLLPATKTLTIAKMASGAHGCATRHISVSIDVSVAGHGQA